MSHKSDQLSFVIMLFKIILSLLLAPLSLTNATAHMMEEQYIHKSSPFASMISRNMIDTACFEDTSYFYESMTLPDPFEPSSLYQNCEIDMIGRQIVCNLSHKHEEIFSSCQMVGGKVLVADVEEYCEGYYYIATNPTHTPRHKFNAVPLCIAQSCKPLEMIEFLNGAMEMGEMEGCRMRFMRSNVKKSCREDPPEAEFFVESSRDGQRSRKCKWLKKKMIRIKRHCKPAASPDDDQLTHGSPKGLEKDEAESVLSQKILASEVCPMTCARKNRFILKKWKGVISMKSCSWLVRQSERTRKRYCKKERFHGNPHSAVAMCPNVCTRCSET